MTKKYTVSHKGGSSRMFVSSDCNGDYTSSVLYKKSVKKNKSGTDYKYDTRKFIKSNEKDAKREAEKWIVKKFGDIEKITQDQ